MERDYRASQTDVRKKDTRKKIQLGGLIIKAGLQDESKALLYGLLLDGKERLHSIEERERLLDLGSAGFDNESP